MKTAAKILNVGQLIMVLGSVLYLVELTWIESKELTMAITVLYAISLVLMLIGWIGTSDERKKKKQEKAAKKKAAA